MTADGTSAAPAKLAYLGNEQAFLEALRERDPAATAALFDAHQRMVLTVLARVLGVDSELRDLLQEVFLRALRGIHTVRDGRVLQQWLRRIAVCTAMDCLRRTPPSPSAQSWRELVAAGQYHAALEQAESDGFEGLCQRSNLSDLLALSEAARFAGRVDRARLALTSLRERFRGEAAASVATFTLGRMAFDSSRDYLGAAKWFRMYLAEQPGGSLAREATGRLVESLERGGDHASAQVAAKDYLARYPDGPQKRLAKQVLAE